MPDAQGLISTPVLCWRCYWAASYCWPWTAGSKFWMRTPEVCWKVFPKMNLHAAYIYIYIKHVQRWVFLGWEYGWVMLGGSNIVQWWHILQDMQTFANPTGISPWKAYDFVEIFAGHAWVSRCMRNRGKKTASLDINLNQDENLISPEWKSDPWNMLNESGFAFHG